VENHLAALMKARRTEILAAWEASVRTLASAAAAPRRDLFNRLPGFLDWLAQRLAADTDAPDADRDAFARHHAQERLSQDFDVVELVSEISLLRECVLDAWEHEPDGIVPADVRRMDAEIDHVIALCVVEYVRRCGAMAGTGTSPAPAAAAH
jgi:hypothetical protein